MSRQKEMAGTALILNVWLVASCFVLADSGSAVWENPTTLTIKINEKGASQVAKSLWENRTAWSDVMRQIASGQADWVEVARALRIGANGGATVDLHDAMFQALSKNPAYVLQNAEPEYPLDLLCEGRADPLPTYKEAVAELNQTRAAIEQVRGKGLHSKKEHCLAKLQEGERHVKRFFGL